MIDFNKIVQSLDIVEVLSDYITLRKSASVYKGLCPFHNEKTPSFTVSPEKKIFKCFGCGIGGNVINFIKEHENISAKEAAILLDDKYGLNIIQDNELSSSESAILQTALSYYRMNKKGDEYLISRGFSKKTIEEFQIGFAPDHWSKFYDYALKQGFKKSDLVNSGLVIKKDHIRYYDRFRNRIMFPIHNTSNRVVSFTGRILSNDKKSAKYINGPETNLYNKSKVLFNLNRAKKYIKDEGYVIIVEGQTDVMRLWEHNYKNVVASGGTALSSDQIKLLSNYTNHFIYLFDGDPAGIKASLKHILPAFSYNVTAYIAELPEGEDPDSFVFTNPDKLVDVLNNKEHGITRFAQNYNLNRLDEKSEYVNKVLDVIKYIDSSVVKNDIINRISEVTDISSDVIYDELRKIYYNKFRRKLPKQKLNNISVNNDFTKVIKLLVSNPNNKNLLEKAKRIDFPEDYKDVEQAIAKEDLLSLQSKYNDLIDIVNTPDEDVEYQLDYLIKIRFVRDLQQKRKALNSNLNNLNDDKMIEVIQQIDEIDKKIAELTQ